MAIAADVHVSGNGLNTFTTSAINTSANSDNLIVVGQCGFENSGTTGALSDSVTNSYTNLTQRGAGGGAPTSRISYKFSPTLSTTHTWTATGSAMAEALLAAGFTGVLSTSDPFDQQNGTGSNYGNTCQTGSVTPSTDGQLIVAIVTADADLGSSFAIDSGFTILDQVAYNSGVTYPGALAYLVQGTAAAVNPTWSWTNVVNASAAIATFKAVPVLTVAQRIGIFVQQLSGQMIGTIWR